MNRKLFLIELRDETVGSIILDSNDAMTFSNYLDRMFKELNAQLNQSTDTRTA